MACSKYSYVKEFENNQTILPQTYIVIRIDGKGFHKFTKKHNFQKPNDKQAILLMNYAAEQVMSVFKEIFLSYGQSDEYSFVFRASTSLYSRRGDKIVSTIVSCFTANYVMGFSKFMSMELLEAPMFDGRYIVYPNLQCLKDYFRWRQVDCHINNLYNTCFWLLVQNKGISNTEAEQILKDTNSSQKNEIMFKDFGINYNNEPEIHKKGTIIIRIKEQKEESKKPSYIITQLYEDLIQECFWNKYFEFLNF